MLHRRFPSDTYEKDHREIFYLMNNAQRNTIFQIHLIDVDKPARLSNISLRGLNEEKWNRLINEELA